MDKDEILSELLYKMEQEKIWFTQKTDPTWENAKQYYKLDEYGNLTDGSINQIVKEIKSYIGDGAVNLDDAIEIWLQDSFNEYKVAYEETLVTKFKDKPVIDNIDAYESQVLNENKLKENLSMETIYNLINNTSSDFQLNGAVHAMSYVDGGVASIMQNQLSSMKKSGVEFNDIKSKLLDTINANIINNKEKNVKTENIKRRLREQNNRSQNLISDMIQSEDFDEESNAGKIVMRTSELFNALSSNGYDVQVSFDNGESTNYILLGQYGGQVVITINNVAEKLKVFTAGSLEINNNTIEILADIDKIISNI